VTIRLILIRAVGVLVATASLLAAPVHSKEEFSLSVALKAEYDPKLTVCTLVRTDKPFYVVLTNGRTNTILSGKLQEPKQQVFTLELAVSQGNTQHGWIYDNGVYEPKLGVAVGRPIIVRTQNHPTNYEREIVVTRDPCPTLDDDVSR